MTRARITSTILAAALLAPAAGYARDYEVDLELDSLEAQARWEKGTLAVEGLRVGVGGGSIGMEARLEPLASPTRWEGSFRLERLPLRELAAAWAPSGVFPALKTTTRLPISRARRASSRKRIPSPLRKPST